MQTRKNVLAFMAIATLIGTMGFTSTSSVIAQTSDTKNNSDYYNNNSSSGSKHPQDDSVLQWVSTSESTPTVDDEEADDQGESGQGIPETGNVTERRNEYTTSFRTEDCTFNSTGRNPFFILEPNYQLVLTTGPEAGEEANLTITVLNETREVNGTETRIVEERETSGGQLTEVSRNFFAICEETNSVFYFGEEVDEYENGRIVAHGGAWLAGEDANRPGIIMPGTILLGARYHQEIAPNVAMDRAEIMDMGTTIQTPAGDFTDTLITQETTALEPNELELKYYAAGIGLLQEEDLKLVQYGFVQ
jgi:hypothetical protein